MPFLRIFRLHLTAAGDLLAAANAAFSKGELTAAIRQYGEGKTPANWRKSFLAEYYKEAGNAPTMYGVRTAGAKLIRYPGHTEWTEFFDLRTDPYEIKNLASDPAATKALALELDAQVKAMNYDVPENADSRHRGNKK